MAQQLIGVDVPRVEDRRLVTGQARFVADVSLPGELHMCVVRSIYPHARIVSVDVKEALRIPGVVLAFSARDVRSKLQPIPIRLGVREGLDPFLQYPLAIDRVRYVGEPVAVVIGETRYAAEDGADAVRVTYDPLDPVSSVHEALKPDAPRLFEGRPDNIAYTYRLTAGRDPEDVFPECDVVVRERFVVQRHTGVPMETRGLIADYDQHRGHLKIWGATKVPHFNRGILARTFGLAEDRVHLTETHVGGGFGIRGELYPEDFLAPLASQMTGRPVKWIEDRREHLLAANHSRQQEWEVTIGATRDGRILAVKGQVTADMGGYLRTHGATVPSVSGSMLMGPYRIPNYDCQVRCVVTNKTPTGTYRAPGRYEANFARERMLDIVAAKLGMDRAELRRRNLVRPDEMPYDTGIQLLEEPLVYDSGDFLASLQRVLARVDWEGFPARKAAARREGRFIGIGVAPFVEKTGLGPFESTVMRLEATGKVVIASGVSDLGQRHETTLGQICGEVLGLGVDDFTVIHGDTDAVPSGIGTFGSRGAVMAGNSALLAAQKLRERILRSASRILAVPEADLDLAGGRVVHRADASRGISFGELVRLSRSSGGTSAEDGFQVKADFQIDRMTYAGGTHAAEVEVDPETGVVKILRYLVDCDAGRVINPSIVQGQLIGGAVQGIGGALFEEFRYSEDGQPLVTTFMDYLVPLATDVPDIEAEAREDTPSPLNPLGVKGVGEGGIASAGAAIANAVADALAEFGVQPRRLPITPQRLLTLLKEGRED